MKIINELSKEYFIKSKYIYATLFISLVSIIELSINILPNAFPYNDEIIISLWNINSLFFINKVIKGNKLKTKIKHNSKLKKLDNISL
jgi:hypothetical protein